MKQITIHTSRYNCLLDSFISNFSEALVVRKSNKRGNLYSVNCMANLPVLTNGLIALLIDIALEENPVYRHSQKLRDMAYDLRDTALHRKLAGDLTRFLTRARDLHLEGYLNFRMAEYREKLDMMSYSLIKKMKLTQQD